MREILFRAKRKDNGEWIEGGYAEHDGKVFIVTWVRYIPDTRDWDTADYYENNPHYNSVLIEVIPETVCQYTGMTDKNEKKIFEGDIIKIHQFLFDGSEYEKEITVSVEYINESACFGANLLEAKEIKQYMGYTDQDVEKVVIPINDFYGLHEESFEIIGNIFDNPELL